MHLDLHVHSTASDGTLSPEEIVRTASASGLTAISITDHDSVEAVTLALEAAKHLDLLLIPGVELSAVHDSTDVHILGFFVDHTDSVFLAKLSELRDARKERARAIVDALAIAGYELTLDEVLLLAEGASVGRSHVARALVDRGHVDSIADAFDRFIGRGRPYYVPKPVATPEAVISTIVDAGGVPVLAHPGVTKIDAAIPGLVLAGLRGLEAYHAEHAVGEQQKYKVMADKMGLIVTGGSDYHGLEAPGAPIGSVPMPEEVLSELLAEVERRSA